MYRIFGTPIYEDRILLHPDEYDELVNEVTFFETSAPKDWLCNVNTSFEFHTKLHNLPEFMMLASMINDRAMEFAKSINFQFSKFNLKMKDMWFNSYTENQSQEKHSHGRNFLSCSYMLTAPQGCADLVFFNPMHEGLVSYPTESEIGLNLYTVKSETGKLVIFPGWLEHGVKLNNTKEPRITFSCNWFYDEKSGE